MDKISVRQSNVITNARYNYTKVEKNIIYHAVMILQTMPQVAAPDLFDQHLTINIPYNKLKTWDINDNMSRDLKRAVRDLRKKDYYITTGDGWIDTGFITYAKFSEKTGLELEISKALVPALLDYAKGFTAYNAVVAMGLKSKYSQRFYEWCCRWRDTGWFEFSPDQLNDILQLDLKTGALNDRVISVAQAELQDLFFKSQNDVYFTVKEERGGRGRGGGLKKWRFAVVSRNNVKNTTEANSEEFLYVMDTIKKAWPGQHELVNKASTQILASQSIKTVAERFGKINMRTVNNLGGYIRGILREEFALEV